MNATVSGPVVVVGPGVAFTLLGDAGTFATVTGFDAADGAPVPTAFVAVTVHVYVLPAVSAATEIGALAWVPVRVTPPLLETHDALYPVIAAPLLEGAVKATEAVAAESVTVTPVGAPGRVAGTKLFDAADGKLEPWVFCAVTVHVYVLPFVSPVTTSGLAVPTLEPVAPPLLDEHVAA